MSTPAAGDRRSVLVRLVTAGVGLIGAGLAGLVGLVAAPRARAPERRWRTALSMFDLPADRPASAVIADRVADGWYQSRSQTVVFIDREGDGYRALLSTCSHLGCRVHWDDRAKQYRCPCHGGMYDRDGRVVAGPPPRPLDRLPVRVNPQTSEIEVQL
jgi:nitrite reductase/ring-hydroxylating ferredoxin subunit